MPSLENLVAIVTGSGGGIGRAVAQKFAAEGARVIVNGRTTETVDETVRLIEQAGGEAIAVTGDVSKVGMAEQIAGAAVAKWGAVDVLVNNAAISGPIAPIGDEDLDWWLETLHVNVFGPYLMTRAVVPAMRKAGRGKIIDVSSGAGRGVAGDLVPYRVSKAGLLRMSTALAERLAPDGIEVNTVDVFATTPMVREMGTWDEQDPVLAARMRKRAESQEPTPEDNAEVFAWLASSKSDGLHGRNFQWWMDVRDIERAKAKILADPRALRIEMVDTPEIGRSAAAKAYDARVKARG
jgi:NAD(P)-dependent dehydrogenase (short-subunit alcohol dehydrogenase family)